MGGSRSLQGRSNLKEIAEPHWPERSLLDLLPPPPLPPALLPPLLLLTLTPPAMTSHLLPTSGPSCAAY